MNQATLAWAAFKNMMRQLAYYADAEFRGLFDQA